MEFKDYYQILGLTREASADDIKRAYRRLARKYHPDVSKEADAEERFKEVNEAYEVLKDAEKRQAYDQLGANWKNGQNFQPPPEWEDLFRGGHGGHAGGFGGGFGGGGFSDFFESLFGGGGMGGQPGGFGGARASSRSRDQQVKVLISLEDAYQGASRSLQLQIPEVSGNGQVVSRTRTLQVRIPKGIREGQRIRLSGQSGSGGDLYLEVEFQPDPLFRIDGMNILLDLPLAPWEAALGTKIQVPTLGGPIDLKIPAGVQSGQKMRIRGRGMPARKAGETDGDQFVVVQIVNPPKEQLDDEARELLERLSQHSRFDPRAHFHR